MSATDTSAFIWARAYGGVDAVPFFHIKENAKFRFKSSTEIFVKGKRGWYSDATGKKYRTGRYTAVIPL